MIPAALSENGKRQAKYFDTKSDGETFISDLLEQRQEHGKQAVSSEERTWINFARNQLGSVERLGEVLQHWRVDRCRRNANYRKGRIRGIHTPQRS
jgi:hypothetical protein